MGWCVMYYLLLATLVKLAKLPKLAKPPKPVPSPASPRARGTGFCCPRPCATGCADDVCVSGISPEATANNPSGFFNFSNKFKPEFSLF